MAIRARSLFVLSRGLRTQAKFDYVHRQDNDEPTGMLPGIPALTSPRQLVQYLDEFCIGQTQAKKVLSVAVFNHYNRVRANLLSSYEDQRRTPDWSETDLDSRTSAQRHYKADAHPKLNAANPEVASAQIHPHPRRRSIDSSLDTSRDMPLFEKSNVLVIGPTGSGKTLLIKTLARVLGVPFSVSDATSFTQAGYVGEDVDACVQRLLQAADWDPYRASMGIIYIDEIDKIARKGSGSGTDATRDVGGEGVQQSLLRIMEGSVVGIQSKGAPDSPNAMRSNGRPATKPDTYYIDTSNVLFVVSGAFVGLDSIVNRRVAKGSIGFGASLAPPPQDKPGSSMPFFTPNQGSVSEPLSMVQPADLVKFGFIPEFISRLPSITALSPLTPADLRRILTDVKGSLISQYTALFGYSRVEIKFTSGALDKICAQAAERGGGARGLRGIMESILLEPMYEVPGSNIRYVLITESTVSGQTPALYWPRGEGAAFWEAWASEEDRAKRASR